MKLFLHTLTTIRIINEPLEWSGTPAEFQVLEPLYPGLPVGATVRYQTPDVQYYEDATGRHTDVFNALPYCDGAYLTMPGEEVTSGIVDHLNLLNRGSNTHPAIDTGLAGAASHIADGSKHIAAHGGLSGIGTNTHAQIDNHISAGAYHVSSGAWVNLVLEND